MSGKTKKVTSFTFKKKQMEEDWDSPTGYSPIDPSTAQHNQWNPAGQNSQWNSAPIENHRSPQRSRGRGFWKDNSSDQNNSRDFEQGDGDQIRSQTFHRTGFGENERRPGPRGRGVLRENFDENEGPRRGRGGGFSQSQGRGFGQSRGGGFGQSREGGFGQSSNRPNWRDKEDEGGDSSNRIVIQVESSLVGRIIGIKLYTVG